MVEDTTQQTRMESPSSRVIVLLLAMPLPTMGALSLATALGMLIAWPQLWQTWHYYPCSIRHGKTYAQKTDIGNLSLRRLLLGGLTTRLHDVPDGVFYPEACWYIGLVGLGSACYAFWIGVVPVWLVVVLGCAVCLSTGRRTPTNRLFAWAYWRIPARFTYVIGLVMAWCAVLAFQHLSLRIPDRVVWVLLLLQMFDLVMNLPQVLPMQPFVQRWERPERAFGGTLPQFLRLHSQGYRVSGLPYPLRTGQVNRIMTLGYNGGSQAQWMATFRHDLTPNGSGAHDWFALNEDGKALDTYGVRYAYTMRPLQRVHSKWQPTSIPHLYENTHANAAQPWHG